MIDSTLFPFIGEHEMICQTGRDFAQKGKLSFAAEIDDAGELSCRMVVCQGPGLR